MNQVERFPKFGGGATISNAGYSVNWVIHIFTQLLEAEKKNMKGKGHAGPKAKRLENGERVLGLLNEIRSREE